MTTVTGMSMTSTGAAGRGRVVALLAGLSEPGPVVAKLVAQNLTSQPGDAPTANAPSADVTRSLQIRSARVRAAPGAGDTDASARVAQLRANLSLPGVKEEIQKIKGVVPNESIEDKEFTLGRFKHEVGSGEYRILHIASHGVFGGNAATSFIMTFDDLLTMNGLESLLKENQADTRSIELLTLSACETAEGNERAPLGISGAAIKARARSVMGTLWPVGDDAARRIMENFYSGLVQSKMSKAQALQAAQKTLLQDEALSHPFFWAPFVLIGNWM